MGEAGPEQHERGRVRSIVSDAPTLVWRPGCASCRAAKEFLTANGVEYESVNPVETDGQARWEELGRPRIPSLVFGGHSIAIYHVSQVASLLGITAVESAESVRLAWDIAALLEAWSDQLAAIDFQTMIAPTPSRGRTIRNLTVNVHEPIHELTVAWEQGTFTWDTDPDEARAAQFEDEQAVRSYADARTAEWIMFLTDLGDDIGHRNPEVSAGAERLSFGALLDAQRFHAAFHYRQVTTFLAERDATVPPRLQLHRLEGLSLPEAIF
jgi:glutaredoxin